MGITWRIIMPLLSTLAALVLIVHSAEEDMERDYRERSIQSRTMDLRPAAFEQPWRIDDPLMHQSIPAKTWSNDPVDEPQVRRKPRRKRKRRPPAGVDEEPTTPTYEEDDKEETTTPRRRRKKLNIRPSIWVDERPHTEGLKRRKLERKKRPLVETWPALSEFGGLENRPTPNPEPVDTDYVTDDDRGDADSTYGVDNEDNIESVNFKKPRYKSELDNEDTVETVRFKRPKHKPRLDNEDNIESVKYSNSRHRSDLENDDNIHPVKFSKPRHRSDFENDDITETVNFNKPRPKSIYSRHDFEVENRPKHDISISEFSSEVLGPIDPIQQTNDYITVNYNTGFHDNKATTFKELDKSKEKGPIDPQVLKEILKRSNGSSLSEILQQNNLSLADLLSGNDNALQILKSEAVQTTTKTPEEPVSTQKIKTKSKNSFTNSIRKKDVVTDNDSRYVNLENISNNDTATKKDDIKEENQLVDNAFSHNETDVSNTSNLNTTDSSNLINNNDNSTISGMMVRRRFPGGSIRRKLRMRPTMNNTYKSQLNRDLLALSARRYVNYSRRNVTKGREWKAMIPLMPSVNISLDSEKKENVIFSSTIPTEYSTTVDNLDDTVFSTVTEQTQTEENDVEPTVSNTENPETTTMVEIEIVETEFFVTEKPTEPPRTKPVNNNSRRQSSNRQKKKRLKHKTSTTESSKHHFTIDDYVSPSEIVSRTQAPKFTKANYITEIETDLEDFLTTEATRYVNTDYKNTRPNTHKLSRKSHTRTKTTYMVTTEKTAKIEIEEILNDTQTSAKLSKILRERNMTLSELLDHRERGSSHVHLADIFHNASREPNPPEPFLSKSLIEPISKETYPLRALLEANAHDTTTKVALDPNEFVTNHVTIPMKMDFGNNVNENAENMGIMSLFGNITKDFKHIIMEDTTLQKDSEGTPYKTTIVNVNTTGNDSDLRESRMIDEDQDMVSWNEIFAMIQKHNKNETSATILPEALSTATLKKVTLEEDVDGDGVIVLEDLQNTDSKTTSGSQENIELKSFESVEFPESKPNRLHNTTKSVTVATAGIIGLAMVLFLLTYAAIKWKQQRSLSRKNTFGDERIPTPVFENRKVKKNCSSRSISPMLPTSNIYTLNTLDSQHGKESPEYMWDTLRKPFQ